MVYLGAFAALLKAGKGIQGLRKNHSKGFGETGQGEIDRTVQTKWSFCPASAKRCLSRTESPDQKYNG